MEVGDKLYVADKETQDKIYNLLVDEQPVWGFVEHMDVLSPTERITPLGANKGYKNVTSNLGTGAVSLNDWADHPVLKANKPYMVKSDGTPDYALAPDSYYMKKTNGDFSDDVSNIEYDGGAFAWFPRIYKYERMEGSDRTVLFSMTPRDGYAPNGFIDPDGNTLEGVWLPMFYSVLDESDEENLKFKSVADYPATYGQHVADERLLLQNFSTRAQFLGGPIVETIIDFLMMISGTTNLQEVFGYGNSYSSSSSDVLDNAVIEEGEAFYATTGGKKTLNKILHSIVLGSYQQWQRDPYEVVVNGVVKVSKDYTYDPTGAKYLDTGITVPDNLTWNSSHWGSDYPVEYRTVPGYGSIPAGSMKGGSTETGGCDGLWRYDPTKTFTGVCGRFGAMGGHGDGLRTRGWHNPATYTQWGMSAAILLLPPAGVTV